MPRIKKRNKRPERPHQSLQLARADAIEAYADLEAMLCLIFSNLMNTNLRTASIVFYRITNTHSRNRIIDELLQHEIGNKYAAFWNSAIKLVRQLDQTRNEIVHWQIASLHKDDDFKNIDDVVHCLAPRQHDSEAPVLLSRDLRDFVAKAEHVRLHLMMFFLLILLCRNSETKPADPYTEAQSEVFLRPLTYPPGPDDQIFRTASVHELLRQAQQK
jgi:hypothetical protein